MIRASDLAGAARLASDATLGLADLVEAVHARIVRLPGLPASARSDAGRTSGITGLVYQSVRGITRLVGGGTDALLGLLARTLDAPDADTMPVPEREALVAALNGVLGDHLAETGNPLAIPMALRRDGRALPLEREALAARLPDAGDTLLVLAHGLCMNDLQWTRDGHDHGRALASELGFTPVYLHYDTGRHVSTNGREFAGLLARLVEAWPRPPRRIVVLAHSMGGLVTRSAMHEARETGQAWPDLVTDLVFLGTPHHGAPLERAGHWFERVLGATPYAAPFARLGRVRSAGIMDLRHGNVLDADWTPHGRGAATADRRTPLPLPWGVRCHALAGCLGEGEGDLKARVLGDGLVPVDSALGRHPDPARCLAFAPEDQWIAEGVNHMDLLCDAGVHAELRRRLAGPGPG